MAIGISGLNHITLAVANVERSLAFYRDVLGFSVRAVWANGAYLEAGSLWLALSQDDDARSSRRLDYTHVAFSVSEAEFLPLSKRISAQSIIWKENGSEGASTYFLDPDGHKLEIHIGSLQSRLSYYRANPEAGVVVLD